MLGVRGKKKTGNLSCLFLHSTVGLNHSDLDCETSWVIHFLSGPPPTLLYAQYCLHLFNQRDAVVGVNVTVSP